MRDVRADVVVSAVPIFFVREHKLHRERQAYCREDDEGEPKITVAIPHQIDGEPNQPDKHGRDIEITGEKTQEPHGKDSRWSWITPQPTIYATAGRGTKRRASVPICRGDLR